MAKYGNSGMHRRGIVSRVVGYIMIGFISLCFKKDSASYYQRTNVKM